MVQPRRTAVWVSASFPDDPYVVGLLVPCLTPSLRRGTLYRLLWLHVATQTSH